MKMLLRQINQRQLAETYSAGKNNSPAPYLLDGKSVATAVKNAKINGVWDKLDSLDRERVIPAWKRSTYRAFQRSGQRRAADSEFGRARSELSLAALALWLDHPKADKDYLQDLLWAICDQWTWVGTAHERQNSLDLTAAGFGAGIAEIVHVLGDKLEDEVKQKARQTIEKRIFAPFWDYRSLDFWHTCRMNWNHVCNGEYILSALYLVDEPYLLARMTFNAIQNMTYALDGFADDGGCWEGPGYWAYGFGHFLNAATALYYKTGGKLNLLADPSGKIERICRYPLAAFIEAPLRATFADSQHGYLPAQAAMQANLFFPLPELYQCCRTNEDGRLHVSSMRELAMYNGFKVTAGQDRKDYLLPDMGMVKLRGAAGPEETTLVCQAGRNDVPHNHNDIGSFIVHKKGFLPLVDPGGPAYTGKTFGPDRYDILFCNSFGHSVPIINGKPQCEGSSHYGNMEVSNLNRKGVKRVMIDMARAYPNGTVEKLTRTFSLDGDRQTICLTDEFLFQETPVSIEEAFVTYETAEIEQGAVIIKSGDQFVRLQAMDGNGSFEVVPMTEESREGKNDRVVIRIRYIPAELSRHMILRFKIS